MSGIAEIPRFCPYCKKDLDAVYSKAGGVQAHLEMLKTAYPDLHVSRIRR